jgi:hypothetical protein
MVIRVLQIVINPEYNGKKLSEHYEVKVEELHNRVLQEWNKLSGESYKVVDSIISTNLPIKQDGYQYTPEEYFDVLNGKVKHHEPDYLDYEKLIAKFNLINRKNNNEFDEVHIYGAPWMGCYESRMVGRTAIWCNAPAYQADCDNFVIMGFNYERGVSEAIEAFGHRTESTLAYCFPNFYKEFTKRVGSIHIPFNGKTDYDWANPTVVESYADMFPQAFYGEEIISVPKNSSCMEALLFGGGSVVSLPNDFQPHKASCSEWGCNSLGWFNFWFARIPKEMWNFIIHVDKVSKG